MPWWLVYALVLVAVLVAWILLRAWIRRRPSRPIDERKLASGRAAAEARARRRFDRDKYYTDDV